LHEHSETSCKVAVLVAVLLLVAVGCGGGSTPGVDAAGASVSPTSAPVTTAPPPTTTSTTVPVPVVTLDEAGTVTVPQVTVTRPRTVAVVGDSLTAAAAEPIQLALDLIGMDVVAFDAVESRRMVGGDRPPGIDAIDEILEAADAPDLWVVALGTNDVGAQVGQDRARDDIGTILRRIPAGSQVVWIDVFIRDRAQGSVEFNALLRQMIPATDGSTVVDWYSNGRDEGVISADGIHLTELGEARFAAEIVAGVIEVADH
jgi:lysophospholipase L1-like esterase